jgi:indolepyruvate ferredoxin oxidoreductase
MAKFKFLRGTMFDPFGHTSERKMERQLIRDYQSGLEQKLARLTEQNYAEAVKWAEYPEHIRGFGHVKEAHLQKALPKQ